MTKDILSVITSTSVGDGDSEISDVTLRMPFIAARASAAREDEGEPADV